jgi:hypothetical protein
VATSRKGCGVELHDYLDRVQDRATFLNFVEALVQDREEVARERETPSSPYGPGAKGWENGTIEGFLDAALRWAEDSGELPKKPSWKAFAEFLYCGKIYE